MAVCNNEGDWYNDSLQTRAGKACVMFKYQIAEIYKVRPGCTEGGAWMKQVTSDIETYPIVANHWYKIKIIFNSNNPIMPVEIWADDQGTYGSGTGENWSGYINIANPGDSGSCKWMSQPGDEVESENQPTCISDNLNHNDIPGDSNNQLFKGLID